MQRRATLAAGAFGVTVLVLALVSWAMRPAAGGSDAAQFLGRFHTLALHLPIGALVLLALAEALTFVPRLRAKALPVADVVLPFLAATSAVAFLLGVLLASGGGYPSRLLVLHRTLTLIGLAFIAACAFFHAREKRNAYRVALFLALNTLSIGAHFGGSMTHGDGYLVKLAPEPIRRLAGVEEKPAPRPAEPAAKNADPLVFADIVLPLLQKKCAECHGDSKVKGGLRLDSYAAVMKGGEHPTTVNPGHGADSELVKRMKLPAGNDDHMPPDDKPGLTATEIELVRFWIDRGATETMKASEGIVPDDVSHLLRDRAGGVAPEASPASTQNGKTDSGKTLPTSPQNGKTDSGKTDSGKTDSGKTDSVQTPTSTGGDRLAFRDDVAPMLRARCGSCHGAAKSKGALRVDSFEGVSAGGKAHGGAQSLLARANLPTSDGKHMPPPEEPQMTARELSLLAYWTTHGATDSMKESELPANLRGYRPVATATATATATSTSTTTSTSTSTSTSTTTATATATATTAETPTPTADGETIELFGDVVAGVLTRRCGACHTGADAEGGLRVVDVARMVSEKDVIPGKPEESPLYTRMVRPIADDAHMPPKEKAQPTSEEIEIVKTWIADGGRAKAPFPKSRVPAALLAAPPATPTAAPAATTGAHASEPSSAVAAVKVPPGSGGCGACAIGAHHGSDTDLRGFWLFALGVAFVVLRRHGGAAHRLRE